MKRNAQLALGAWFLLAVLIFSAAFPLGAQAQDPLPPPEDTLSAAPVELPAEATPTPTATPEGSVSDTSPGEADVVSANEQGPIPALAGVEVVVLDAEGNELALASAEAAEIIANGDPIWCPNGVDPVALSGGCTGSYLKLEELILALSGGGQPTKNGTIWIMIGPDSSVAPIILDGGTLGVWKDYSLTFQGGWDGSPSGTIIGESIFKVPLQVLNWANDVSLNDLVFDTTSSDGIKISTTGNIRLDDVESRKSLGRGADLNNTAGGSSAKITVRNSSFNDNVLGLNISTLGDVSLSYVDAEGNDQSGLVIENARNVSLDRGDFSWNGALGLDINALGKISVDRVDASHNTGSGAQLRTDGDIAIRSSTFDDNVLYGLDAQGYMLSLIDVGAEGNGDDALRLDAGRDATLRGVDASYNGGSGAAIWAEWNILVDFSAFTGNDEDGANLDSEHGEAEVICSSFRENDEYGVRADLPGELALRGSTFGENGTGAYVLTGGGTPVVEGDYECYPVEDDRATATPTFMSPLRMNVVDVEEGQLVKLDCQLYRGTILVLPSGDQVVLPCPIAGDASLTSLDLDDLPAPLDGDLIFGSAMEVQVSLPLDATMLVDFVIPIGEEQSMLSVFRWDDLAWTELGGIRTTDGFIEAQSTRDGVFVLAIK